MLQHSALCEGTLYHSRRRPRPHRFQYPTKMVWLDLDEIEQLDELPFWSGSRRALVQFRRQDYLQPHSENLKQAVYSTLQQHQLPVQAGRVVLLTQLCSWGHSFNPVSFYFCYDQQHQLYAIVAEITNTPWRERHQYVLQPKPQQPWDFEFDKTFHVSPFMPMGLRYRWRFRLEQDTVLINMCLFDQGDDIFHATLNLQKKTLTATRAVAASIGYPLQCLRVLRAIYWQALRLWLKRTPVYEHPESTTPSPGNVPVISAKQPITNGDS